MPLPFVCTWSHVMLTSGKYSLHNFDFFISFASAFLEQLRHLVAFWVEIFHLSNLGICFVFGDFFCIDLELDIFYIHLLYSRGVLYPPPHILPGSGQSEWILGDVIIDTWSYMKKSLIQFIQHLQNNVTINTHSWNSPGMDVEFTWNLPRICLEFTWNGPGMDLESTWNRPGIHLEFTWNGPGMTWNPPGMDLEWTWNGPGICLEWPGIHLE